MRTVHAQGFVLEPQLAAHADEMFALLSDPAIYAFENEPPPSADWLRQRFAALETRCSADGREQWLNWVVRLPGSELAGYVQATVHADGRATIAYVLASRYWNRGLGRKAVQAMIDELAAQHRVTRLCAVFKRANHRSRHLLECLGFAPAPPDVAARVALEPDERLMQRAVGPRMNTAAG